MTAFHKYVIKNTFYVFQNGRISTLSTLNMAKVSRSDSTVRGSTEEFDVRVFLEANC